MIENVSFSRLGGSSTSSALVGPCGLAGFQGSRLNELVVVILTLGRQADVNGLQTWSELLPRQNRLWATSGLG